MGLVQVKTGTKSRWSVGGRTDRFPSRLYIFWITAQPLAFFGDSKFCARACSIAHHETAYRSFSERHRAPLLPEVPPIADGAGAYHARATRAGIADIRVFQMRAHPPRG